VQKRFEEAVLALTADLTEKTKHLGSIMSILKTKYVSNEKDGIIEEGDEPEDEEDKLSGDELSGDISSGDEDDEMLDAMLDETF
jgi:hypothetical protein